jgi:peptide/nickel transport system substrate-binding protein
LAQEHYSRRSFLKRAAALGGLAAAGGAVSSLLAACGGGASPAATTATATRAATGATANTLIFPLISNPTPDPLNLPGGLSSILLNKTLFCCLVRPDPQTDQPSPDLAQSWDISTDGLTYTFHLRDAVWHDGQPVTADDVKFTLDAQLDPNLNGVWKHNLSAIDKVEVVDPKTVKLTLKHPYGPLLTMLQYNVCILPKHALEGQDLKKPTKFVENPIGCGPYKWKEFVQGDHLTVTAFDKYWDGKPNIDSIVFEIIPDVNTQLAKLKAGSLDFVMIEPSQISALNGSGAQMSYANQTNYYYLAVNNTNPLFKDVRVRQAMAYAIDRQKIIDSVMLGHASLAASPISPPMGWAFDASLQPYPYDVNKAKDLLAQAGAKMENGVLTLNGQPFKFKILVDIGNPTRKSFGLIAQQYWQALGMQPELDFEEFNNWYSLTSNLKYDVAVEWWITPADPDAVKGGYYSKADGTDPQHPNFSDPETDRLFDQGAALTTPAQRQPVYFQLQQRLKEMQPDIFLNFPKEIRAFSSRVKGFGPIGIRDALIYAYKWTLS